ncbi:hypothetical protein BH10ACI2_BH10ACI2_12360 [soil metagenome]
MRKLNRHISFCVVMSIAMSLFPLPLTSNAQDLVSTEDLAGGSSVFVFRESRKKPQSKLAGGKFAIGGLKAKVSKGNAQIAAAAQKRRAAAIAARKKAVATANRKLALSNTLTAKAEQFLDNNQTDTSITNFRDALVQNPKNTRASDGLSNALTAKGIEVAGDTNSEAAIIYFDEAVKLDKQNDVALAKLGAIYDAKGDKDKALASYEKAVAINPEYTMLYAPLGAAYLDSGDIAKAEESLRKSDAAQIDNVDVRMLRGILSFKQNKNPEALAAFDGALQLDSGLAEAQYYRGQIMDRMSKPDQSIAAYKKSIELDPAFTPASFDLGVAYYNKGDYTNAAALYESVVKKDPKNYQAHANLASAHRQLERYSDANAEYKLASDGIKTADLYSEWGFCLGKTNEWDKSVARLETAKDLSPVAIDNSNLGWAYYNSATTQTQAKQPEKAKANYALARSFLEVAVQQDPKLDAAFLNLGSTHNALGEFQLAVGILKTALVLHKDWNIATNQLGVGYRGLNDFVNAIAMFKRVTDVDKNNVTGLFNLGEAYNASGNTKEAKKINDRLRKINPAAAARLDGVFSGKSVVDQTKQKIQNKIPKFPKFPL